ncbi:MAG: hypothetical protein KAY50_06960 [Chitinophagaceae bacterium]|nr:hypothetical protein [Chitinophagaceae bacterium]
MKSLKTVLFFYLTFTTIYTSFAQSNDMLDKLPVTKEEFVASEKKVISTIQWLEDTPLDQDTEKRKAQYALFVAWITNSPTVTISVNSRVLTFTKKNSDLLIIFMGGWTKYCLENNYSSDELKGNIAGIKSAIKVYKKGIGLKKDKAMDKIIELDDKGELEKWVTEQLAIK